MKFICFLILLITITFSSKAQTNEELSVSFVKQLARHQYDSCYAMFDTVMAGKFSVGMLEQMWQTIPRYMGEYKS